MDTTTIKPIKPPVRISHARRRLERALQALAIAGGIETFNDPIVIDAMTDAMIENAIRQIVSARFGGVTAAATTAQTPDPDAELSNFRLWLSGKSEYYRWPPEALATLRERLVTRYKGATLIPAYAHSVGLRCFPSGQIIVLNRQGFEVIS